jgi:ABC-type multidrug transport system fused ATPase/permease subunit
LIDIILSLLEPQTGILEVDETIITKINARSWQQSIGYVSQHIYLCDDTVLKNIAFGVDVKNINKERARRVAKIAHIHDFITNELPKKYQTKIGEQGIKLSGGQRQRIGIARALYNNPKVLILDEATSALDNKTEKAVMDSINSLRKNMTIIIIAHRLNTVKNSDIIYEIEHGRIVSKGNFRDFIKNNKIVNYN